MTKSPKSKKVKFSNDLPSYTGKALFNKVDSGPVPLKDPVRLDCSAVAEGGEHELWLLQLPVDFNPSRKVEWEVRRDPADGFRGRCEVDGKEFLMVPDSEAGPAQLYASPRTLSGPFVPVTRRVMVLRATTAPALCFGQSNGIDGQQQEDAGPGVASPPGKADAAVLKRKVKQLQQPVPAPAVAAVQEARGGATTAPRLTPSIVTRGAEGHKQQSTPVAAAVVADAAREQVKSDKKKRKRKHDESEGKKGDIAAGVPEPAAAPAALPPAAAPPAAASPAEEAASPPGGGKQKNKKEKKHKKEHKEKKKEKKEKHLKRLPKMT